MPGNFDTAPRSAMKKITALITSFLLFVPGFVFAAPQVYGNLHISLNQADNDVPGASNNLVLSSNTSAIGVKGSEDLLDGLKVIYKAEFQINLLEPYTTFPDNNGPQVSKTTEPLSSRDQFAGFKGGLGIVAFGVMSSNYKQTGREVDPLYRTPLEARGFLHTQSADLHGGRGLNRGRMTNVLRYTTPKLWKHVRIVANATFSGSNKESRGLGIRWKDKNWLLYADWLDSQTGTAKQCVPADNCSTATAQKYGLRYQTKAVLAALQYERAADRTGGDYLFGSFRYSFNSNNQVILTAGQYSVQDGATGSDSQGYALAYNHRFSRLTNIYFGYGIKNADQPYSSGLSNAGDEVMYTMGVRKRF